MSRMCDPDDENCFACHLIRHGEYPEDRGPIRAVVTAIMRCHLDAVQEFLEKEEAKN